MKKILAALCFLLLWAGPAMATFWDGGVHTIGDGESYGEADMANDATLFMTGGYIFSVNVYDTSDITVTGGRIEFLDMIGKSTADLMNGQIEHVRVNFPDTLTPPEIRVHTIDYTLGPYRDDFYKHLTGTWLGGGDIDILVEADSVSYLHFVPEPATLAGVVFGGAFLRIRHHISNNV